MEIHPFYKLNLNNELLRVCRQIQLQMVSFFTSRGQLHDALLVAQVACEGGLSSPEKKEKKTLDLKKNDMFAFPEKLHD